LNVTGGISLNSRNRNHQDLVPPVFYTRLVVEAKVGQIYVAQARTA